MAANPSIQLGTDGNWAIKEDNLLAYKKDGDRFFNKEFDFTRGSIATYVDKDGLIKTVTSDIPRIDFLNNTKGHLLLEPSRQNEVTNSVDLLEYFNNTTAVTETSNATTSPDGSVSAYKYEGDGSSTSIRLFENRSFSENTTYSLSVFAKAGTNNFLQLGILGVSGSRTVFFDLSTATASLEFGKIENYGNGWYRCSITADVTTGDLSGNANIYITKSLSETGFDSNSDAQNATMFLWGAQLEAGYATSYIPTQGSAVTRSADSCSQTPPDGVIGQTEGTIFIEIGVKITPSIALFECGQGSSQHRFFVYTDGSNKLKVLVVNNYSVQVNYTSTVNVESNAKIAIGYANNNYAIYLNGSLLTTDTNATVPPMNQIAIGADRTAIVTASNQIKQTKLYNTRLSDGELYLLTVTQYQSYQEMATALNYTL